MPLDVPMISSATGKPLEAVANALGKAYDGNLASLGKDMRAHGDAHLLQVRDDGVTDPGGVGYDGHVLDQRDEPR